LCRIRNPKKNAMRGLKRERTILWAVKKLWRSSRFAKRCMCILTIVQ
jgi:hypothetical protein